MENLALLQCGEDIGCVCDNHEIIYHAFDNSNAPVPIIAVPAVLFIIF